MEKRDPSFQDLMEDNPFKVPEGYPQQFKASLMSKLPEKKPAEEAPISFRQRFSPWLYLAASFLGLIFFIRFVVGPMIGTSDGDQGREIISNMPEESLDEYAADDEMFFDYMESRFADEILAETYDSNGAEL